MTHPASPPWLVPPAVKYGLRPAASPASDTSPLPHIAGPSEGDAAVMRVWHPESPIFWFGVVTLTTFGLMAVSGRGSIRLGPFRASASAGAGKTDEK